MTLEPWDGAAFSGAKLAVLSGDRVVAMLRDDLPTIPFPNLWDIPGGGREGDESPDATALRELEEETGLRLDPVLILWRRSFGGVLPGQARTWFLVARDDRLADADLRLGDEGQKLELMPVARFMALENVIPHMRDRLSAYFADAAAAAGTAGQRRG